MIHVRIRQEGARYIWITDQTKIKDIQLAVRRISGMEQTHTKIHRKPMDKETYRVANQGNGKDILAVNINDAEMI